MDLNLPNLGTLQHLAVCFIQQGIKFIESLPWMTWFLLVLLFNIIHIDNHIGQTGTKRLTHTSKYISLTWPVICTQQVHALHWMNNLLIQNLLCRGPKCFCFSNITLVEAIYLLIRFSETKFFLWNTKNTERNVTNESNTYTTHWQKDNFRKG